MIIELSPTEIQQAIQFYLGSEYSVESIQGTRRKSEGSKEFDEFVLEIGCTRDFEDFISTKAPVPINKVSAKVAIREEPIVNDGPEEVTTEAVETVVEPEPEIPWDESKVELAETQPVEEPKEVPITKSLFGNS